MTFPFKPSLSLFTTFSPVPFTLNKFEESSPNKVIIRHSVVYYCLGVFEGPNWNLKIY